MILSRANHITLLTLRSFVLKRYCQTRKAQLAEKEPSEEELVAMAKSTHPYYYRDLDKIKSKIAEIEAILNG